MKWVFLDAACWVAAVGNPRGGSAEILKLGRSGKLVIVATQRVLREAEKNIREEWGEDGLTRFHREISDQELLLIHDPTGEEEAQWQTVTSPKDCHVLAGAYKARAAVVVTLDRKHLLTEAVATNFPIPVMHTTEFVRALRAELDADAGEESPA
jgi:predicted nucleic acid-binding protein